MVHTTQHTPGNAAMALTQAVPVVKHVANEMAIKK